MEGGDGGRGWKQGEERGREDVQRAERLCLSLLMLACNWQRAFLGAVTG